MIVIHTSCEGKGEIVVDNFSVLQDDRFDGSFTNALFRVVTGADNVVVNNGTRVNGF